MITPICNSSSLLAKYTPMSLFQVEDTGKFPNILQFYVPKEFKHWSQHLFAFVIDMQI